MAGGGFQLSATGRGDTLTVGGLETVAEIEQRLPAVPRIGTGQLQLTDGLIDLAARNSRTPTS